MADFASACIYFC